ncbi:DUF4974 domain-containing protein [Carboxylicivirga sp. A043]|uniref:FecR family protein n=1 Tax=Carboxylicivirga litoralis TaxID=2816963 RepID=UPI0021CB2E8B|nr:FecR domain-containing protein [Carboxylicivirga sp. A043]MCU4158293.1 DUF4974 domain-containing protein [Carboxylicivirga sp. A043]
MRRIIDKKYNESIEMAQLLRKMVTEELSDTERQKLAMLITKNNLNNQEDLNSIISKVVNNKFTTTKRESADKVLEEIKLKFNTQRPSALRRLLPYSAAAAVVTIMMAVGIYLTKIQSHYNNIRVEQYNVENTTLEFPSGKTLSLKKEADIASLIAQVDTLPEEKINTKRYTITVPLGTSHTISLKDGTNITLFPQSKLTFPAHFNTSQRLVTLEGEAYFDVESDPTKPFLIEAGGSIVKVLGTSFNVRAYPNENKVETALVSGKVNMNNIKITPDQMAVYDRADQTIKILTVNASIYQERANGMFVFDNKRLEEIMYDLSMWYNFEYDFNEESMRNKRFRFKLSHKEDFKKIMGMMELTGDVKFKVEDQHVLILNKGK